MLIHEYNVIDCYLSLTIKYSIYYTQYTSIISDIQIPDYKLRCVIFLYNT